MSNIEDIRQLQQELWVIIGDRDQETVPLDDAMWSNLEVKTGMSIMALREDFRGEMASTLLKHLDRTLKRQEAVSMRQSIAAKETTVDAPAARKPLRPMVPSYEEAKAQQTEELMGFWKWLRQFGKKK